MEIDLQPDLTNELVSPPGSEMFLKVGDILYISRL